MSTPRTCLRPLLTSSASTSFSISQCNATRRFISSSAIIIRTNHQRPSPANPSANSNLSSPAHIQRRYITRPILQQVQQQPPPPAIETPPPGYRMNKITRPFVPVATHMRVPFPVNESLDVLKEMYKKLLGDGGEKALTEEVMWQCVTHKSFDHGLQAFNTKLTFFGRRIAFLHTTLSMIHKQVPPKVVDSPIPAPAPSPEPEIYNDPTLPLPVIARRNPVNSVSYISVGNLLNSANLFGIARACKLVQCLRWKPRNSGNLIESGVEKVAEDAIFAIIGAVALQRGGDAARRVMEERILPGARVIEDARNGNEERR